MTYRQTTLGGIIEICGAGLHTGAAARMRLLPVDAGTGRVFDLNGARIPALAAHAEVNPRNTTLRAGDAAVHTVEHVLSALYGLGVDNAVIELDAPEPPVADGSAAPFVNEILRAGIVPLDQNDSYIRVDAPVLSETMGAAAVFAVPCDAFRVSFAISYDHPLVPHQEFDAVIAAAAYAEQVAPARTYGFIEEVEALRRAGLALGGSGDNALVIYKDSYSSGLRFDNEPARHKVLDLIGDLSLLGRRVRGHFFGYRSGHALNAALVRRIAAAASSSGVM